MALMWRLSELTWTVPKEERTELAKRIEVVRFHKNLGCKRVGFFLKISKEIGKAWRKSLTREKRASLTGV